MPVAARARRTVARVLRAVVAEWYAAWRRRPVRADVVLFESFGGNAAACNPEALFRAMRRASDLGRRRAVWALDRASGAVMRAEFRGDRSVRVVRRGGLQYWRWLATAGTLVNNATFPPAFARRGEQTYLNTWHGTPLKRMGFDEPDGAAASANTIRNFLQATHLLSQNRYMTDTMYRGAYKLDGFATAPVLELGYPRNDRLRLQGGEESAIRHRLRAAGIRADRRIVLYAPTWRGARFSQPEDHSLRIAEVADAIQRALDAAGAGAEVIVKPHQAVTALARKEPALDGRLAPEDLPVNSLLAVTDVLVSDYSSIVVDYLATGRPIVFAAIDGDDYAASRGLSVPLESFPGRRCTSLEALAAEVVRADRDGVDPEYAARYAEMAARMVADDDGNAADRVLDQVFRGIEDPARPPVRLDEPRHRPTILVHLGGMRANGITSSALNLLHALAGAGIDVTALYPSSQGRVSRSLQARIDPRIRSVQRVGGMNGSKLVQLRRRLGDRRRAGRLDPHRHRTDPGLAAMWDAEWRRCFGDVRFDAVVDFSGYSPFWATLLLHSPEPVVRSMWMHNDMTAEVERLVGGKPRMRRSLRGVIGMYDQYDRVVAVSESLRAHNAAAIEHLFGVRTSAARNLVDDAAIRAGAAVDPAKVLRDRDEEAAARAAARAPETEERGPWERPAWLDGFGGPDEHWFVCVGRLSPEKNHERLLAAFALVHAERPETRLLVVGAGYLRSTLERLVVDLEVEDAVVFLGAVSNPYPFMAAADCVVVSSDHEGQPMVILEAAVLDRPILSTRFDSARDALPDGGIHLVDKSAAALADGMRLSVTGRIAPSTLDAEAYNRLALAEFLEAVLGDQDLAAVIDAERAGGAAGAPAPAAASATASTVAPASGAASAAATAAASTVAPASGAASGPADSDRA